MGMSASQVRFLSLQSRKHDIGRQLTTLSNRKMALSRDMNRVSNNYNNALNQKTLKWSNDSGATYQNLSYDLMMKPNTTNTAMPYIVSTRDGKVIVDNNRDLLSGYDADHQSLFDTPGESYRTIAEFITTYQDAALGINGGAVTTSFDGVVSGSANKGAYKIPNDFREYGYDTSLRMQCLQKTGIITQADMTEYNRIITELYGSNKGVSARTIDEWLSTFDANGNTAVGVTLANGSSIDVNYEDIFGNLSTGDTWSINGGSALGNLALAKAYQTEYQLYLNTPIHRGVMSEVDNTDELKANGVSNRIVNACPTNGKMYDTLNTISFDEETYNKLKANEYGGNSSTGGKKAKFDDNKSVGFQKPENEMDYDAQFKNVNCNNSQWSVGINVYGPTEDLRAGNAANAPHAKKLDDTSGSQTAADFTWAQFYDVNGTSPAITNSYGDTLSDGAVGYSQIIFESDHYVDPAGTSDKSKRYQSTVDAYVTGYAKALQTSPTVNGVQTQAIVGATGDMASIQKQALAYAQAQTYEVFTTTPSNNSDSRSAYYNSIKSAAARAAENFGMGQNRRKGESDKWYAVNPGNIMKVFNTFYNMYMDSAITYTKKGHSLNPNIHSSYGDYDSRVLNSTLSTNSSYSLKSTYEDFVSNYIGAKTENTAEDAAMFWENASGAYRDCDAFNNPTGTGHFTYNGQTIDVTGLFPGVGGLDAYKGRTLTYTYTDPVDGSSDTYKVTYDSNGRIKSYEDESHDTTTFYNDRSDWKTIVDAYGKTYNDVVAIANYSHSTSGDSTANCTVYTTARGTIITNYNDGSNIQTIVNGDEMTIQKQNFTSDNLFSAPSAGQSVARIVIKNGEAKLQYYTRSCPDPKDAANFKDLQTSDDNCYRDSKARVSEYKYENETTGETYFIRCHGGNEGHGDVLESKLATSLIVYPDDLYGSQINNMVNECQEKVDKLYESLDAIFSRKSKVIDYFDAIFQRISESGWQEDNKVADNRTYLDNKLQNNEYFVTVCTQNVEDNGFDYINKAAGTVTKIYEVNDDNAQNEALSKYEAEKNRISSKEKKVDLIMQKLQTEQEAVNTEMESVQKIENENIEKTFKIFA